MKVSNLMKNWLALIGLAFLVSCTDTSDVPAELMISGRTMGTTYSVKLVATPAQLESTGIEQKIDDVLKRVNQEMSTYIKDSELSLFNHSSSTDVVTASDALRRVTAEALRIGAISNGALDVTIGPVVNLWGFGPEAKVERAPSDEKIAEVIARTGLDKLSVNDRGIQKSIPDLYVDLSSLAKGFGVDEIADILEAHGFSQYIAEIGGEMRISGKKLNGNDWRIAIEKPVAMTRSVQRIIEPGTNAVATSGDYRNYFEENGVRYSHMIEPTTGKPVTHKLVSVTVIHPSCMSADGLATAISVLGPDKGFKMVEENKIAAMLVVKEGDSFKELVTDSFKPYLVNR